MKKQNKSIDLVVDDIEGDLQKLSKFIVCSKNNALTFYAMNLIDDDHPYHKDIAATFGIAKEDIVGGGKVVLEDKILKLFGWSTSFGPIPADIANEFGKMIKDMYSSLYDIQEIEIDKYMQRYLGWGQENNGNFWKKLGYKSH